MKTKMTDADVLAAHATYTADDTLSLAAVGAMWGVDQSSLWRRFNAAGLPMRARRTHPMTDRQRALLRFIIRYKCDHDGDSPTIREMMRAVGFTSTSVANHNLLALERRGLISRPFKSARSITVTGGRWVYEPEPVEEDAQ